MKDLLFSAPWWLLALLLGGGGYVWYVGNTRSEKSWKIAGIAMASIGLVLFALGWLVETDKEHCEHRTRQIVAAVDRRDWTALQSLLDPQTSLEGIYLNRDQIVAGAKKTADTIGLSSASITSMETKQHDTVITIDVNIYSLQDATLDRPAITSWQFDWSNTGTGWKLQQIEPLGSQQVDKADLVRHLDKP